MSEGGGGGGGERAVAPAGSKRKTRTPHSDVGIYVNSSLLVNLLNL